MKKRRCVVCGCEIPKERLETLPDTEHCVHHSTEKSRKDVEPDAAATEDLVHLFQQSGSNS